jgi:hypothetical protein
MLAQKTDRRAMRGYDPQMREQSRAWEDQCLSAARHGSVQGLLLDRGTERAKEAEHNVAHEVSFAGRRGSHTRAELEGPGGRGYRSAEIAKRGERRAGGGRCRRGGAARPSAGSTRRLACTGERARLLNVATRPEVEAVARPRLQCGERRLGAGGGVVAAEVLPDARRAVCGDWHAWVCERVRLLHAAAGVVRRYSSNAEVRGVRGKGGDLDPQLIITRSQDDHCTQ